MAESFKRNLVKTKAGGTTQGYPLRDIRYGFLQYMVGSGLDVGCARRGERIITPAIGVDAGGPGVTINCDPTELELFNKEQFDYVFVGDILNYCPDLDKSLQEYWRVLVEGGYLILSNPDGEPRNELRFSSVTVPQVLERLHHLSSPYTIYENDTLLVKQRFNLVLRKGTYHYTKPKRPPKKDIAWVIRYGALGDQVISTAILPALKEKYSYVIWNCQGYGSACLENNPYIDEVICQPKDCWAWPIYHDYWGWLREEVAGTVINLSATVEEQLLRVWWVPEFYLPKEEVHKKCNINYYENQFTVAELDAPEHPRGLFYLTEKEEEWAQAFVRDNIKTERFMCWGMSGSAHHKAYPWSETVCRELMMLDPDLSVITLGGEVERLAEWDHPRTIHGCAVLSIRESAALIKYADLVVAPETAWLHIAGAFGTPVVGIMSHSTIENETKHFLNDYSIEPDPKLAPCYPCHKLHHVRGHCPEVTLDHDFTFPACMAKGLPAKKLFAQIRLALKEGRKDGSV